MRRGPLSIGLVLAAALATTPSTAKAQVGFGWPSYGGYGFGGYGFGYPGAAAVGFGVPFGYGGFGYPGSAFGAYNGFGSFGYGGFGSFGYGGFGASPFGMGGVYPVGFGYQGFGPGYGAVGPLGYPPLWNNPASLSLGITPLALQSALMERGLGTLPMHGAGVGFGGAGAGAGQGLPAGLYRIEPVDPNALPAAQRRDD